MKTLRTVKQTIYAAVVVLIVLLSIHLFRGAHDIGSGQAFGDWMSSTGVSWDDWAAMSEATQDSVRRKTDRKAVPYALFMGTSMFFIGSLVVVALAYTFREKSFTRRNATLVAIGLCIVASICSSAASAWLFKNSNAWFGGIPMAIVLFLGFYLLTGVLELVRRAVLGLTNSGNSENN